MKRSFSRRNFLQLASLAPLLPLAGRLPLPAAASDGILQPPNVIILLFDALAAANLSLYGYPRRTSPNLERFAQRAIVYHHHHAAGNFTTPSTASLFTGTYPWTHRAFSLGGLMQRNLLPGSLLHLLGGRYFRFAFTQNVYADMLLHQMHTDLERHERLDRFTLAGRALYSRYASQDGVLALKSLDQFLFKREEAHGSLFLSLVNDWQTLYRQELQSRRWEALYPQGLPRLANTDIYFSLSEVMQGIAPWLNELPAPFFAYLHLMPPHEPYVPARPFLGRFNDGWAPEPKKRHRLAPRLTDEKLNQRRKVYDEFIANLDDEFGRLLDHLERSGLLENSVVIFTSDHGEMFERGVHGHSTPVLFEAVTRIPLVISLPGQTQRQDVFDLTSNVDLLPTLLHLAGLPIPAECEGQILPGFGAPLVADRSAFVVEAKRNPARAPLRKASLALLKGSLKLVRYMGYASYDDAYELYDLENDPDELRNLYPDHPQSAALQAELNERLAAADRRYQTQS